MCGAFFESLLCSFLLANPPTYAIFPPGSGEAEVEEDGLPKDFFFTLPQSETALKASDAALNALAVAPNNLLVAGGGKARVVYVWKLSGNALSHPSVPLRPWQPADWQAERRPHPRA